MRKYLLFALSVVSAFSFFLFQHVSPAQARAVGEGESCGSNGRFGSDICDSSLNLECIGSPRGICSKKQGGPAPGTEEIQCTCLGNGGSTGGGNNGFSCGTLPPAYCKLSNTACYPANAADAPISRQSVNFNGNDAAYQNKILRGVKCDAQAQVQCTCSGEPNVAETGKNAVNCKLPGQPDGNGFCGDAGQACVPGGEMNSGDTDQIEEDAGGQYSGKTFVGAHCGKPEATCTCANPGVGGSGNNKITCTLPGQQPMEGYCGDASQGCFSGGNSDPSMVDGFTGAYGEVKLVGVTCTEAAEATWAPPPSPPCTTGKWVDGQCTSLVTAFGELQTDPSGFVQRLFAILLSFSGGIALLLIVKSGYQILTSQGKPEQLQAGRDQLVAAVVGLVFLIFSLVLLQIIGYDILRIPGFSGAGAGTGGNGAAGGNTQAGAPCDLNSNTQCGGGLTCVASGQGRAGTCQ